MDKNELLIVLSELEKKALNGKLSNSDKSFIEDKNEFILRRKMGKFCNNSYHDATVEMIIKLKKIKTMDELKKSKYLLKNGIVIRIKGSPMVYTNSNLTDDAAERYLYESTERLRKFSAFPEDWQHRIKDVPKRESLTETPKQETEIPVEKSDNKELKEANKEIAQLKKEIKELKKDLENAENRIVELVAQAETPKRGRPSKGTSIDEPPIEGDIEQSIDEM